MRWKYCRIGHPPAVTHVTRLGDICGARCCSRYSGRGRTFPAVPLNRILSLLAHGRSRQPLWDDTAEGLYRFGSVSKLTRSNDLCNIHIATTHRAAARCVAVGHGEPGRERVSLRPYVLGGSDRRPRLGFGLSCYRSPTVDNRKLCGCCHKIAFMLTTRSLESMNAGRPTQQE
jgi:hypothetical protein